MRRKLWITFGIIVVLAIAAGIVDFPGGPNISIGHYHKDLNVKLGLDLQGGTRLVYDADTSKLSGNDREEALQGGRDVIERRVNAFGVSEPVVQTSKYGNTWRVSVELAGVKDVNQAIRLIGETPLLEFREEGRSDQDALTIAKDVLAKVMAKGSDFSALAKQFSDDPGSKDKGGDLGFAKQGAYVEEFDQALWALKDGEVTKDPVKTIYGYHIIQRLGTRTATESGVSVTEVHARHILIGAGGFTPTALSGKNLKSATVQFDQSTGNPEVNLSFDTEGAKLFAEMTKRDVGKRIGIFLDGTAISTPVVEQEINSGNAVIRGNFALDEAKTLVRRLNAGALPVPISLVSQQTVGPSLGKASIARSFFAGIVGILAVVFFMIAYYRFPGFLASIALTVYALLVLAVFKLWPVTLTLAGIAGFILSIGMAVDANVLIFERVREELRGGRPLQSAIDEGFRRAWLSIRDSNISSLITALILAWFGTSIIKGFAITLAIGIAVSMFTAITVTRTFLRIVVGSWLMRRPWLIGPKLHTVDQPGREQPHV